MVCKSWPHMVTLSSTRECPNISETTQIPTPKPYIFSFLVSRTLWWYADHDNTEWSRPPYTRGDQIYWKSSRSPLIHLRYSCSLFHGLIDWLIDWLIIYGFTSRSRIFHLYGDITITGERLKNLGPCSAPRAFEQGGIFIVPRLMWHGTSVFPASIRRIALFSRLLRHTRGWGGSILTRILTGFVSWNMKMWWYIVMTIRGGPMDLNKKCCIISRFVEILTSKSEVQACEIPRQWPPLHVT
jgi:hypothetical protein